MSAFDNATLMITGGTGSFGSTVLKHFLDSDLKAIRIFSRDEKKQDDMRHELQAKHPDTAKKVKFYIGDVRNPQSIRDAMPRATSLSRISLYTSKPSARGVLKSQKIICVERCAFVLHNSYPPYCFLPFWGNKKHRISTMFFVLQLLLFH